MKGEIYNMSDERMIKLQEAMEDGSFEEKVAACNSKE